MIDPIVAGLFILILIPIALSLIFISRLEEKNESLEFMLQNLSLKNDRLQASLNEWMGNPRKLLESGLQEKEVRTRN